MWWMTLALAGPGVANPGGERIPFVNLRSERWDIVLRRTRADRARVERVRAQCDGVWVNGCAPGVDPELRQIAMHRLFQDGVVVRGDFSFCSTPVVSGVPEDLAKDLVKASPDAFCQVFLDPESVRSLRSGDATSGETDMVGRLFGGAGKTSGSIKMKAPPVLERPKFDEDGNAIEAPEKPAARAPVAVSGPVIPGKPQRSEGVSLSTEQPVADVQRRSAVAPVELADREERAAVVAPSTQSGLQAAPDVVAERGQVARGDLDLDDEFVGTIDPGEQQQKVIEPELASLLEPIPGRPADEQVVVPAPKPPPKKRKKKVEDDMIIIDIESLPE